MISTGKYAYELCEYLAASGHHVEVISTAPHYPGWKTFPGFTMWRFSRETLHGVIVWRVPMYLNKTAAGLSRFLMPLSWSILATPVLLWRAVWLRPAVIIAVQPTITMAPSALLAAWLSGASPVQHVQDMEIDTALAVGHVRASGKIVRLIYAIERQIMRKFDRVITISHKMRSGLTAKGIAPDRVAIVRNWVDTELVRPLGRPSVYRSELGIADETFVVQYSGQMGRKQALNMIVEAADRMVSDSRFIFVVAGDGPMRPEMEQAAARLRNIRLLPLQPTDRLGEFLNLADCHILPQDPGVSDLVLPSKLGGMLASGKRILITADADGELANFLGNAVVFTQPGDVDAIVAALDSMVSSPDMRAVQRKEKALELSAATLLPLFERSLHLRPDA